MHEIRVRTVSAEEASYGVAELWAGGHFLAYTLYEGDGLMLRINSRPDGGPVTVGAHGLADALAEVDRLLASHSGGAVPMPQFPQLQEKGTP